jgi:ABC-type amino acid transport substrate-binding protein
MRKVLVAAFAALLGFGPLQAADSAAPLRVGVAPTSPPIRFVEMGKLSGLEIDFALALGKELGRPVQFMEMEFSRLIPSLIANEIDIIMSGMSMTRVRSLQVSFSDPYLKVNQMALVRSEDRNNYLNAMSVVMTDKTVGAKEHTTSQFLLTQEFVNAKKRFFRSPEEGAKALRKKKIDLLVLDAPYVWWLASKNEGELSPLPFDLTEENLGWAVHRENETLLLSVNTALGKWKKSGEWASIVDKWLPGFSR